MEKSYSEDVTSFKKRTFVHRLLSMSRRGINMIKNTTSVTQSLSHDVDFFKKSASTDTSFSSHSNIKIKKWVQIDSKERTHTLFSVPDTQSYGSVPNESPSRSTIGMMLLVYFYQNEFL